MAAPNQRLFTPEGRLPKSFEDQLEQCDAQQETEQGMVGVQTRTK